MKRLRMLTCDSEKLRWLKSHGLVSDDGRRQGADAESELESWAFGRRGFPCNFPVIMVGLP